MSDDSHHRLTLVRRLFHRRAKKVKTFWLSCLATRKRLNRSRSDAASRCDGETQTTPTMNKTFILVEEGTGDVLKMKAAACEADSSRNSLDSELKGSCESSRHAYTASTDSIPIETGCGAFPCQRSISDSELSKWPPCDIAIMEKLSDLQREIHLIHATLSSIKSDVKETVSSTNSTALRRPSSIPPPPPPPPPFPPSPVFLHSVSLQTLHGQPPLMSKIQCDEMSTTQDKTKPIVTLEDLQRVKLRQVSSAANMKC